MKVYREKLLDNEEKPQTVFKILFIINAISLTRWHKIT